MRRYVIAVLAGCAAASGCGRAADDPWQSLPPAASAMAEPEGEGLLPIQIVGPETEFNTEAYDRVYENPFLVARDHPLSTFSIDVDTIHEARKVLVEQLAGTLVTIAKDVKIQVDFNPAQVGAYRLIGYENRLLRDEDFRDDTKDAGEIGAGHTVTALYELIPAGQEAGVAQAEPSKYQQTGRPTEAAASGELLTFRLRYKQPAAETSEQISFPIGDAGMSLDGASGDFRFAAAVACFGMLLRNSEHRGEGSYDLVVELAESGKGDDPHGYRAEFVKLVELAKAIQGRRG